MRIGFLFNHDQVHQVAHALPIAAALTRMHPAAEIVIAVTNDRLAAEVARLSIMLEIRLPIVRLAPRRYVARLAVRALDGIAPAARLAMYYDNLDFFRRLDILVVTEKTSLVLRRHGLDRLTLIHTRHGAGDRAIGFDRASAGFDHVLVSGTKVRDRLIAEAGVAADRISIVGYPKFDLTPPTPRPYFPDPDRPIVLYNPHSSPGLSSWFKHGRAVLDHFRRSDRYNLIFAPHVMLFQRRISIALDPPRLAYVGRVARAVREAPHIHVDLGSAASTDMTYTVAADLYLGDVSSQVYEFIERPRPCVFLDSHDIGGSAGRNYRHWNAGSVIGDPAGLEQALDDAFAAHARYLPAQRRLLADTFDLTAEPSSIRAARAIMRVAAARRGIAVRTAAI